MSEIWYPTGALTSEAQIRKLFETENPLMLYEVCETNPHSHIGDPFWKHFITRIADYGSVSISNAYHIHFRKPSDTKNSYFILNGEARIPYGVCQDKANDPGYRTYGYLFSNYWHACAYFIKIHRRYPRV